MAGVGNIASGAISGGLATPGAPVQAGGQPQGEGKKAFADVWNDIQAKFGGKEEKPREIKKQLGKDDFLKIMITQLQHQDPTKPMEADKMATQMAQLTSVEQMQNMNKAIERLGDKNSALDRITMAGLIGKQVTVDRNRFPHQADSRENLSYTLKEDATQVKLLLISEHGEVILEKEVGAQKAGEGSFLWDGKQSNSLPAKSGNYILKVEAKSGERPLIVDTQVRSTVVGVNFEGSEPMFLVGNGVKTDKVPMKNVIRIDADSGTVPQAPAQSAQSGAGAKSAAPLQNGQFFSFVKGEGSKPLDPNQLPPDARAAIDKFAAQSGQKVPVNPTSVESPSLLSAAADTGAKGFPSGLQEESAEKGVESQ